MMGFAVWYTIFTVLLVAFLLILWEEKRWLYYMVAGSALGFAIDLASFSFGYYTYPGFYTVPILGLPFSMTLAEGFSVAITIWLYERLIRPRLKGA